MTEFEQAMLKGRHGPKSGEELMAMEFAPLQWVVPDILPAGCYLLAARPKVGKSWLALGIALAVATGGDFFGRRAVAGDVLYLALEDNPRRMKSRIQKVYRGTDTLSRFYWETQWPRVDEGGLDKLRAWLRDHPSTRLVIVDVIARMRAATNARANPYEADYQAGSQLKQIADEFNVCMLAITHVRKGEADDPLDMISGTLGLSGAVDGALVIKRTRGQGTAVLHVIGRDIEKEGEWGVEFEDGRWTLLGTGQEVRISAERQAILDLLDDGPMTAKEIASGLGKNYASVRKLLRDMFTDEHVEQRMDRKYQKKKFSF